MLIKIIKSTVCGGRNVTKDDEVIADKREGTLLIRMGKASEVKFKMTKNAYMADSVKEVTKRKSKKKRKN